MRKNGTMELPKTSPNWKKAYNKRVIIEQIFSELKESFGLNALTQFKLSSIFAYITLSIIAYNLSIYIMK
ncbi:transposase [Vallitalea sp.]|uniref:transposase n=1 Tax=Vallitalea sp. TaxID=1882829 RepID=UPI003FCD3FDB